MTKLNTIACVCLAAGATAQAGTLDVPSTVVLGIDVFSGPTFTVSGSFTASDSIDVQASGTVDLASGQYTANAAGILVAPPTSNTGSHPGQTFPGPFGFPYAALLIGNNSLGFFPLFPASVANGLGNSTPPTTISVDETLGSIFGPSVSIPSGTVLELTVNDINTYDNSGYFTVGSVPDGSLTITMLGMGISGLAFIRRKL